MRKYFVFALGLITILCLLGAGGLGFLLAKFDPNDYKSQFQAALEEATGWKITLHDDLAISFLPTITLKTGRVSLEIPGSRNGQSAHIGALTLALSGEHLHQGFLDVQEIRIQELHLSEESLPASFFPDDGSNPTVKEALRSLAGDQKAALPQPVPLVEESTGTVAPNAAPGSRAGGIRLQVRFPGRKLILEDSSITGRDDQGNDSWTLFLASAEFEKLGLAADVPFNATGEFSDPLNLKKSGFIVEGSARFSQNGALRGSLSSLRMRMEGFGDLPIAAEGSLVVDYNLHTGALSLKDMQASLRLAESTGFPASDASGYSEFKGGLAVIPPKEGLAGAITGDLQAGRMNLDMLLHGLDPSVRFVEADGGSIKGAPNFTRPKVTRVLTASTGTQFQRASGKNEYPSYSSKAQKNGRPYSLMGLASRYSFSVNLKADELIAGGLQIMQLAVQIRSSGGRAALPFSFMTYGASVTGNAAVNITEKNPSFALSCRVKGMHMGKLSSAWTSNYYIGGVGNGYAEVSGHGSSGADIISTLKGKAGFEVVNGEVQGFNLIPPDLPYFQNLPDSFLFHKLSASADIEAGKATMQNILLESNTIQGKGSGVIHLSFGQLDIGMNFSQEGRYVSVPVFISGPYASLSTTVDAAAYNKNMDRMGVGQYYDGYNSPYYRQEGETGGYSQGGQGRTPYAEDPYARNPYSGMPPQADPYRQYLNRTPLSGVQWQTQNPQTPPPRSGGQPEPSRYEQQDRGMVPRLGSPADIIYGR